MIRHTQRREVEYTGRQPRGRTSHDKMVEVLNPSVREPWQKLKEYFMN
jgi:hypothetical protein